MFSFLNNVNLDERNNCKFSLFKVRELKQTQIKKPTKALTQDGAFISS